MAKPTTPQILEAVSAKMAAGKGFNRIGSVDHFDGTVKVNGITFSVKVAWPDGAEAHELAPEITEA